MKRPIAEKFTLFVCCLFILLTAAKATAAVNPDPMIMADLKTVFNDTVRVEGYPYQELLTASADKYNLPLPFVLAVVRGEAFFDPAAKSSKGAIGLMQVMPSTAADYGLKAEDLFDPAKNIDMGTHYLADLYARLSDPYLTLAAYYCGCGGVDKKAMTLRKDCDEYVHYIHTHLTSVLARAEGKTPAVAGIERHFVLTQFDNFLDAEGFLQYLSKPLPQLQIDLFRREVIHQDHVRYQYQIIVSYVKEGEKDKICRDVERVTGFSFCR